MNTYNSCIVIVAVPLNYSSPEKIREHLLAHFPGIEMRISTERSVPKPFVEEVVIPDWHEPAPGIPSVKPRVKADLFDAATAALREIVARHPK